MERLQQFAAMRKFDAQSLLLNSAHGQLEKSQERSGRYRMTVARILAAKGRDVVRIEPHRTLAEATEILMARNIGAIVVVDAYGPSGHVLGILWERDIVHAIANYGAAALNDAVSKYM